MENTTLYHYGVKGMKWGVRKDKKLSGKATRSIKTDVVTKKGEIVELYKKKAPALSAIINRNYVDYDIKTKDGVTVGKIDTNLISKDELNIEWISVNKNHSGKGYGQSAMRTIIDDAKKQGVKKVTLEVPKNSPNARHIYEKMGFKKVGEVTSSKDDVVWDGLTSMELALTNSSKNDKPKVSDEKKKAARKKALKISGYVAATVAISALGAYMTASPKVRGLVGKGMEAVRGKQDLRDDPNAGKVFNNKTGKYEEFDDVFDYVPNSDGTWSYKRKPGH